MSVSKWIWESHKRNMENLEKHLKNWEETFQAQDSLFEEKLREYAGNIIVGIECVLREDAYTAYKWKEQLKGLMDFDFAPRMKETADEIFQTLNNMDYYIDDVLKSQMKEEDYYER